MTSEEVLTCAINIGEQLLVSGAEISRVEDTIRRICNAYGIRQSHIFSIASCIIVTGYGAITMILMMLKH